MPSPSPWPASRGRRCPSPARSWPGCVEDHGSFAIDLSGPGMPTFIVEVSARSAPMRRPSMPILSPRDPVADERVVGHATLLGELDQLPKRVGESKGCRCAEAGALVHERCDRDHPAVALAADNVLVGTQAPSMKSSLNSASPVIWRSGRTSISSCSMSIRK